MYEISFYEDKDGYSDICQFIKELREKSRSSKESRILFNKIVAYLDLLQEKGTRMGTPYTKHLGEGIWELRPARNRLLYAYYKERND